MWLWPDKICPNHRRALSVSSDSTGREAARCCSSQSAFKWFLCRWKAELFSITSPWTKLQVSIYLYMIKCVLSVAAMTKWQFDHFWILLQTSIKLSSAGTYPNQSGCTTRSTSSQRRRRRLAGRGDTGLPPAARSNSPWCRTGRRPPPPCSPSTGDPGC